MESAPDGAPEYDGSHLWLLSFIESQGRVFARGAIFWFMDNDVIINQLVRDGVLVQFGEGDLAEFELSGVGRELLSDPVNRDVLAEWMERQKR